MPIVDAISNSRAEASPAVHNPILEFPKGFLWGVSTAAHQVEGGNHNNQWAAWEAAGRIRSGDNCGLACDWWDNAEKDFDLAQKMGLNSLRLSVVWSRFEPREGRWFKTALTRYRAALNSLHQLGIRPMVCLHHFTHPQWFESKGAFLGREAAYLFDRFTRHVVEQLGDLCQHWSPSTSPMFTRGSVMYSANFLPAETAKSLLPSASRILWLVPMPARITPSMRCSLMLRWDGLTITSSSRQPITARASIAGRQPC
jgi:beta-glucosidase/6-phospho-beta-glucosidase/beta-galactosidase